MLRFYLRLHPVLRLRPVIRRRWPVLVVVIVLILVFIEAGRFVWASAAVNQTAQTAVRYAVTGQYDVRKYTLDLHNCPIETCAEDEDARWAAQEPLRLASIRDVVSTQIAPLPVDQTSGPAVSDALKVSVCSSRPGFSYDPAHGVCTPYDDAGGPGDMVTVHVSYNYPVGSFLGAPISIVPIEAVYNGTNEAYRTAKVINIADLGVGNSSTGGTASSASAPQGANADQVSKDRKIVMNGSLSLQVASIDDGLTRITQIAQEANGYVASSESSGQGGNRTGKIQIRIPADQFQDVVTSLKKLATTVLRDSVTGEDVTEQYVNLQSQLTALRATYQRTQDFLAKAQNVDEALKVSTQMGTLEQQIEQITGQINYLSNRIDFSTISVDLIAEHTALPIVEEWLPGTTVERAVRFLGALGRLAVDVVIWVIVVGVPLGLIILVGTRLIRRLRQRTKPAIESAA